MTDKPDTKNVLNLAIPSSQRPTPLQTYKATQAGIQDLLDELKTLVIPKELPADIDWEQVGKLGVYEELLLNVIKHVREIKDR